MKAKGKQNSGLLQITSTQAFLPIRDVKDGIIITKDGRFVKLMEFSPINFALRSYDEQASIIADYAAALRSMPRSVQFKVVARKADVSAFVANIERYMATEKSANCRVLQSEQIDMIKSFGENGGISRRFFLAFEYEDKIT